MGFGAIAAAAANYASKTDAEAGEILSAVSNTSIEVFNYFSKLDSKYEVLDQAKGQLENALEKVKSQDNANPQTIEKIENALSSTSAIIKAGELNEEYQLSSKATVALADAVEKAKEAAK